ncbi:hypothetical protein DPMN_024953 [Dreissena polymorpha]|uniref:Uncharacterized protein n=2 Tax=Dreissena polymorpha TaxID=45954 RepID=A0A9D4LQH5_DREPO|nr:hypothetical protein DPMN_024953 [Dreissena polymorpha]
MLNPILYAFLSGVFRKSFIEAFKFTRFLQSSKCRDGDKGVFPRSNTKKENGGDEKFEFTSMVNQTENTCMLVHNAFQMTSFPANKSEDSENEIMLGTLAVVLVDKEIQTKQSGQDV